MSTQMVRQTKFTLGEVDQVNWRRTDQALYMAATQRMQNMEASLTAVVRKRRGFQFLADTNTFAIPEMQSYEFKDNNGQYYIIFAVNLEFLIYYGETGDVNTAWTLYQTVTTPYLAADLFDLDYSNDNDSLVFAHGDYPMARLYVSSYSPSVVFSYSILNIYPLPAYDFGLINYNNFVATFSVSGANIFTLQFTGLSGDPGFTSAWIGGEVIGMGASANVPAGYGIIATVGYAAGVVTFTGPVIVNFGTPYGTIGSQYIVRQPVFNAEFGYPETCLVYQNRLWVGGIRTLPQTIFGSRLNTLVSFDVGTGRDTDAIIYKIGIPNTGNIVSLNAGKQFEIYTENNELVCPQGPGQGLTQGTLAIRQQTSYGSSGIMKPVTYLNDSFYAAKAGKSIQQFHFNGIGQDYSSKNVSELASHLVNTPIGRALQRSDTVSQDNYLYFLNLDKTITSFQFDTGQKVAALSPVVLSQGIQCINIVSIDNQIVALVYLPLTEQYQLWGLDETIFMDGWKQFVVGANNVIDGLAQWNGYTFTLRHGTNEYDNYLVVDGQITVSNELVPGDVVQLGLTFDVVLETMYIYAGPNLMDAYKRVTKIYVDYYNSLAFQVNGVTVPYQKYTALQDQTPLVPESGQYKTGCADGWKQEQTILVTQHNSFDLQIQSISYQVTSRLI